MTVISVQIIILMLFCVTRVLIAISLAENNAKYEEYIIEHEISSLQAKNAALSADINEIKIPAGCQKCTKEELHYCTSSDLISDHCCCDRRFHEFLPYIPHTCYFGTQLCSTVASDCNKYTKLRTCCCDKYLLRKWKEKYGSNDGKTIGRNDKILLFLFILIIIGLF